CTRSDLARAASAPADAEPIYPGTCRNGIVDARAARAVRFRVPPGVVRFEDAVFGAVSEDTSTSLGDFVVKRADGPFAHPPAGDARELLAAALARFDPRKIGREPVRIDTLRRA